MLSKNLVREVSRMAVGILILSAVMVIAFALLGYFDITVVFGALLGAAACVLNYFFLALSIQKVVDKKESSAKGSMGASYALRMVFIAAVVVTGIKSSYFNYVAVIIPFLFPRIVIMVINFIDNRKGKKEADRV